MGPSNELMGGSRLPRWLRKILSTRERSVRIVPRPETQLLLTLLVLLHLLEPQRCHSATGRLFLAFWLLDSLRTCWAFNFWQMETRIAPAIMPHFSFGHVVWLAGGCSAKDVGVDKETPATALLDTENKLQLNELQRACWKPIATCLLQQELSSCSTKPAILRETRTFYDCGFQFAS